MAALPSVPFRLLARTCCLLLRPPSMGSEWLLLLVLVSLRCLKTLVYVPAFSRSLWVPPKPPLRHNSFYRPCFVFLVPVSPSSLASILHHVWLNCVPTHSNPKLKCEARVASVELSVSSIAGIGCNTFF